MAQLHAYLTEFGYFPNPRLESENAAWRPIVGTPPKDPEVFDNNTQAAIRALQRNSGLKETGIVDAETRELISRARCGVPDGIADLDPADKFDLRTDRWSKNALTWKVVNGDTNASITRDSVRALVGSALSWWSSYSAFTFSETSGTPDIKIVFDATGLSTSALARTVGTIPSMLTIQVNTSANLSKSGTSFGWSTSVKGGYMDLYTSLAHELGHAIGLSHSSVSTWAEGAALMRGDQECGVRRMPTPDDRAAAFALNPAWSGLVSGAADISYSSDCCSSDTYILKGAYTAGCGWEIWHVRNQGWNDPWEKIVGCAIHVASGNGLWALTEPNGVFGPNNIWRYNNSTQTWSQLQNACATDIAIASADGSVWITGCDNLGDGNHTVYKWDGAAFSYFGGSGVRISAGPTTRTENNSKIVPWVVKANGDVYRYEYRIIGQGWYSVGAKATDIAVSKTGVAWITSTDAVYAGYSIKVLDEQNPDTSVSPPARSVSTWITLPGGGAKYLTAASTGLPLVITDSGDVFTPPRPFM